jgi:mRNA interferase RelE/StbE
MHRLLYSRDAQRFLDRCPRSVRDRIETRLRRLCNDPVPSDTKFLGWHLGDRVFRYRVGDYRVLYKVKEGVVLVTLIEKRSRVYDR